MDPGQDPANRPAQACAGPMIRAICLIHFMTWKTTYSNNLKETYFDDLMEVPFVGYSIAYSEKHENPNLMT